MRCLLALLSSPLGVWLCAALTCQAPHPDLAGYFKPPMLLITVKGRPFGVIECEVLRVTNARGGRLEEWTCE
jgi:hypothetical protein